jgi:hypothetical protein
MNYWTAISEEFANQKNYLDELYKVYPIVEGLVREIDRAKWTIIEEAFNSEDKVKLISTLLGLELFPIKDSYVAYLKRDPSAIARNPETVNRLYGRLAELGLEEIFRRASAPKETNRQMGQLFSNWLKRGSLGVDLLPELEFLATDKNAILAGGDHQLTAFARKHLGYQGEKGLDFLARFNKQYVLGEAKFLTDFGGHQNAQFEDAKKLLHDTSAKAVKIAILDGVLYIKSRNNKMHRYLEEHKESYILSSLVLREFLYQL